MQYAVLFPVAVSVLQGKIANCRLIGTAQSADTGSVGWKPSKYFTPCLAHFKEKLL